MRTVGFIIGCMRIFKPWVIARSTERMLPSDLTKASVCVAKPSQNWYIGQPVGSLSAISASIVNLASHGEMSIAEIVTECALLPNDMRLINLLPTKIKFGTLGLIGERKGRFLNHFGYRKEVMSFFPQTLEDHAWVACALSYANSPNEDIPFDDRGGSIAGGVAGITQSGAIFRGSGVADNEGVLVSPIEAMHVSLAANGEKDLIETHDCSISSFYNHKFFKQLRSSSG